MEPDSELLLLSIRKQTLENENTTLVGRAKRLLSKRMANRLAIRECEKRAAVLNEELKEQQENKFKYGKI